MARGKKGSINNIWAHCFYLLGFLEGKSRGKEGKEQAGSHKAVLNATNGLLLQLQSPGSNDVSQVPDCGGRDGSAARGQLTTITGQWILHGPATLVPRESAHTCTHSRQCANTPHKQSYLKKKVMYLSNFSVHENYPKLTWKENIISNAQCTCDGFLIVKIWQHEKLTKIQGAGYTCEWFFFLKSF